MSATGKTWFNNQAPSCEDDDLNGFKNENNNLIEGSNQTLSTADNQQTNKAVATYASVGEFFTGGGIADAYTIAVPAPRVAPHELQTGMMFRAIMPANNTGACTLNPFTIGASDIKLEDGVTDPVADDIVIGVESVFTNRGSFIELMNPRVSSRFAPDKNQWPVISNAADTAHDINFSTGKILSDDNSIVVTLSSALIKQIDAAWAVGTNAGGLFTGSVAADTTYHCFVIVKDSDNTVDAGFDTDLAAGNIPVGYTVSRRIASVKTDSSSNIINFLQFGDRFVFDAPINDFAGLSSITTAAILTLSIPAIEGLEAIMDLEATLSSVSFTYISNPLSTDIAAADGVASTIQTQVGVTSNNVQCGVTVNSSGQIRRRSSVTNVDLNLVTIGWVDQRVK